jgi:hypothetical protein
MTEFKWDGKEIQALLWDSVNAIDPALLDALDAFVDTLEPVTSTEEDDDIFLTIEEVKAIFGGLEDEDIIF